MSAATRSFAAQIEARSVSLGVVAASALAGLFFYTSRPKNKPASLSASWKAEEKTRALACPRVASERPVVLNPFRNVVV